MEENINALIEVRRDLPPNYVIAGHPGYGYLSENEIFSEQLAKNGFVFVGPTAKALEALGNKAKARWIAKELNVPLIPGYDGKNQDPKILLEEAIKIKFPVMIKGVDGGGGVKNFVAYTIEEAKNILDNLKGNVILEKFLDQPQHIEFQIIIDKDEVVVLGSRDCSLQRRYQKIIEIAPAETPHHQEMFKHAKNLGEYARKLGYTGPATIEFLQTKDGFYFIECNPRLQVEHAVTERILGNSINTIELQLHIAAGKSIYSYLKKKIPNVPRNLTSQEIVEREKENSETKAAAQARVNAAKYLPHDGKIADAPAIGQITKYEVPLSSKTGCVESGVGLHEHVDTSEVNPLISLAFGFGKTRKEAMQNLEQTISKMTVEGIPTNIDYLKFLLDYLKSLSSEIHIETCKQVDKQYAEKLVNPFVQHRHSVKA